MYEHFIWSNKRLLRRVQTLSQNFLSKPILSFNLSISPLQCTFSKTKILTIEYGSNKSFKESCNGQLFSESFNKLLHLFRKLRLLRSQINWLYRRRHIDAIRRRDGRRRRRRFCALRYSCGLRGRLRDRLEEDCACAFIWRILFTSQACGLAVGLRSHIDDMGYRPLRRTEGFVSYRYGVILQQEKLESINYYNSEHRSWINTNLQRFLRPQQQQRTKYYKFG